MSFLDNTRKPDGLGGKWMVRLMNLGHGAVSRWALRFLSVSLSSTALDCGCGGGANLARLLKRCPKGRVCGIDYSDVSVEASRARNRKAIEDGRCEVAQASVAQLPYADATFARVTAFETVYFWPELSSCFREVRRVMRPGGTFLICNELGARTGESVWTEKVSGMTVYTAEQLTKLLLEAGFHDAQAHEAKTGWLYLTVRA